MKVGIRQKVLLEILEKGAIAATSVDAQADTSIQSLLVKSIKITVDKHFTVESNTELLAVKFGILASEENGIVVKEAGGVVIPAKEFIDWVKLQGGEATITMTLQKLQNPEIINTIEGADAASDEDKSKFCVKKIGTVKLSSKGVSKTQTKWEIDCFDVEDKQTVNFSEKSEKSFEIQGQHLLECLDAVTFAALAKDSEHVLDSISMQVYDKSLYFAATDLQHCALYKAPAEVEVQSGKPLLVSALLMNTIAKIINGEEKVGFAYSEEKEKVYITQTNLRVRVASTEKQKISKFPSMELLLKKPYKALTECSRSAMIGMLANASFINPSSALFVFLKENGTLTVKAISEDAKLKPNIRQCEVGDISKDAKAIWGVTHLLSGLKVIKSTEIQLHLPDNMKSLKITAKGNENFIYFTMAIDNSIYNTTE